jgi:hypothetical protein
MARLSMRTDLWASVTLLLLLATLSCSSAPPLPPLDEHSPANPQAAEAPLPRASRAFESLDDDTPPSGAGHEHGHEHGHALEGAYVCPMHEDVVSDTPGHCPRCRMALVKRPVKRPENREDK